MKEIRARLVQETVMLSKLALLAQDKGKAAHEAGDTRRQHTLENIDWKVRQAVRLLVEATEYTTEGETK